MSSQDTEEKEFRFICDGCGYKTNRSFNLKKQHQCKKAKEYKCDLCEFVGTKASNLTRHKTTVHVTITIPNTTLLVNKCAVCAYVATDSSDDLLEHKKVHDEMILKGGRKVLAKIKVQKLWTRKRSPWRKIWRFKSWADWTSTGSTSIEWFAQWFYDFTTGSHVWKLQHQFWNEANYNFVETSENFNNSLEAV